MGKKNLTELRLHNIIRESINKLLLTEDRGSRSMKSAKNDALEALGDKQEAVNFVNKVRNELELHNAAEAFILGGVRMKLKNQYDDTNKDKLVSVIHLIADKYLDKYKNDLNGLSAQELITKHLPEVQAMRDNERNDIPQEYDGESDYEIVRIDSFEQAQEYGNYADWCVTYNEEMFDSYTSNGVNQFYFCLRNGFEEVEEVEGEGYPLDEYGLSMFAVRVNEDGDLIGCTTRWNLSDGRDQNAMNVKQISEVIRMDFYSVFKPNTTWRDRLSGVMQRLSNGENPRYVFDDCDRFVEGFAWVKLNGKYNYINQNGEFLSPSQWFDECYYFSGGFGKVELNNKWNFINKNGELLLNQWVAWCDIFHGGFAIVRLEKQYNFINQNGELLSPNQWFDSCNQFVNGFARVRLKGQENFINQNGEFISDQWFSYCYNFKEGFARVCIGPKMNFINQNGEIAFPNQWFDGCEDFKREGFAEVHLLGEWYYIDKEGNITKKRPRVSESYLRDIIRESVMKYIKMDTIK